MSGASCLVLDRPRASEPPPLILTLWSPTARELLARPYITVDDVIALEPEGLGQVLTELGGRLNVICKCCSTLFHRSQSTQCPNCRSNQTLNLPPIPTAPVNPQVQQALGHLWRALGLPTAVWP